jgi:hypothetical protein
MPPIRQTPAVFLMLLGGCSRPAHEATTENPFESLERQVAQERQAGHEYAPPVRLVRAVEVLGHIDGPEARELLVTLARGAPEARATREASAALALRERWGRRR